MARQKNKASAGQESFIYDRFGLKAISYPVAPHANTLPYSLGGLSLTAIFIQVVTGIFLSLYYNPEPNFARDSVAYITNQVYMGWFVRGVHYWTAHIFAVLILLHMLRIIITGSYQRPREINWYMGIILLALSFGAVITGSILKWDQEGFEALVHMTETAEMVGVLGQPLTPHFGTSTTLLARIFTAHVSIIIIGLAVILTGHLYLIKVLEISPMPWGKKEEKTQKFTDHLRQLAKYGTGLILLVSALALLLTPPLGTEPVNIESGVKPWWMFLWIYGLENLLGIQAILIGSGVLGLFLILVPIIDRKKDKLPDNFWQAIVKRKLILSISLLVFAILIGLAIYGWVAPPGHME